MKYKIIRTVQYTEIAFVDADSISDAEVQSYYADFEHQNNDIVYSEEIEEVNE